MLTPREGVDDIGIDLRYGENGLGPGFLYDHVPIIGAAERESLSHETWVVQ